MRKRVLTLAFVASLGLAGLTFTSCNDEEDLIRTTKKASTTDITNYSNFLSFTDIDEMNATIKILSEMDSADVQAWEHNKEFISLNTISDIISEAEDRFSDSLQMIYRNPEDIPDIVRNSHSEIFNTFSDILIKKTIPDSEQGIYYDLDIGNYEYAGVLNRNGIVKIGSDIYQFKENSVKIILGGDISKIDRLDSYDSTNMNDSIIVHKKSTHIHWTHNMRDDDAVTTSGKCKIIIYHNFYQWYLDNDQEVCTSHRIKVRSLKKHWYQLGTYNNHKVKMFLNSKFQGNTVYGYIRNTKGQKFYSTRTWTGQSSESYKKFHTIELYFFATHYFPFLCDKYTYPYSFEYAEYPKLYNGTFTVYTSDNISCTLTF